MRHVLLIALGGALGATLRYGTHVLVAHYWQNALPLGTWIANLLGCLLIGMAVPLLGRGSNVEGFQFFFVVGFLGAFTTFSTYSLETVALWEQGLGFTALLNVLGSSLLGVCFVVLGLWIGRVLV